MEVRDKDGGGRAIVCCKSGMKDNKVDERQGCGEERRKRRCEEY
jgi:hypothetical protein